MPICHAWKMKLGASKPSISAELSDDAEKHGHWAGSIALRYEGARPKDAPIPRLSTDGKATEEIETEESTCGECIVPLRDYARNPSWGDKIEDCSRVFKSTGEMENFAEIFSSTMPPCRDVIKVTSRTTNRTGFSLDFSQ